MFRLLFCLCIDFDYILCYTADGEKRIFVSNVNMLLEMIRMITFDRSKLREQITLKGLNARQLAKQTGLSEMTVGRILRGQHTPLPATIKKITDALGCKPEALYTFETNSQTFFERLLDWKNADILTKFFDNADDETQLAFWRNYLCDVFENGASKEAVDGSLRFIEQKGHEVFHDTMKMLYEIKNNYQLYMKLDENGEISIYLPPKEYDHMVNTIAKGGKDNANG